LQSSNWSGYEVAEIHVGANDLEGSIGELRPLNRFHLVERIFGELGGYWRLLRKPAVHEGRQTLIQLGTEQDVSPSGATQYYAWYEMLPKAEIPIETLPVKPGDQITASLSCGTTCSNRAQTWLLR
jgi:hypothetical protein